VPREHRQIIGTTSGSGGNSAVHADCAVADWGPTGNAGENMVRGTVMAAASRSQSHCFVSGNVITAEILNGSVRVHHEILWRPRHHTRELNGSSPTFILLQSQLAYLTKLRSFPLGRKL